MHRLFVLTLLVVGCAAPEEPAKGRSPFDDIDTSGRGDSDSDSDSGWDTGGQDTSYNPDADTDGDGLSDVEEGRTGDGSPRDSDGDGTPDYLDADSDNDGIDDSIEGAPVDSGGRAVDTDGDGTPDYLDTDSDDDGIQDSIEGAVGQPDTDGDSVPDYRDADSDGDGMLDVIEGIEDWDGDGVENYRDSRNDSTLGPVLFQDITTEFNSPIGIDFHEPTDSVVLSVNYSTGNPLALERVSPDGTHVPFSALSGVTDEVKIATVRSGGMGGFAAGELFVGNGVDGEIVRVSADGASIDNPWVSLPGDSNGLMRGSLYVDRTDDFGGDLIVVTTLGQVWRVNSAAVPSLVADLGGVHLEGLITVPNAPERFGPLAGCAIAGAEEQGLLYAFAPDGSVTSYDVGVNIEDIDLVVPYENFFGVNYGTSRLVGAIGSEFLPIAGDILLTQETHGSVGLYRLYWDGSSLQSTELRAQPGSAMLSQWEHTTFAAAGIQEVPN